MSVIVDNSHCPLIFTSCRKPDPLTVAIHFKNGTTRDLGKFDGTPEYLLAMRALAEDAQNVRNGMKSSLKEIHFSTPHKPLNPPREYWWSPYTWYRSAQRMPQLSEEQSRLRDVGHLADDSFKAIADMLSRVKSSAMNNIDPPLDYNYVLVTRPDFEQGYMHNDGFRLACYLAGLDNLPWGNIVSGYALRYEGVDNACDDEGWGKYCDLSKPNLPTLLVVSYNAASLGVTLNTRFLGLMPSPECLNENPTLGAGQANTTNPEALAKYWTEIRESIESVIGNATVNYLLLLGSHALDPDLLRVLEDVIDSRDDIDQSILDRYTKPFPSQDDKARALFAGARDAAMVARFGLEFGFTACDEPSWCGTWWAEL
ncbi:hypothetical protein BGW36DRAFT_360310 [Talaromyces proteolyticus]|uniref:Uncharacterized protein n=1 Tax=Talaromyces proteolyticus TaxID=1131652 RepID=A0AAD4KPR0_9EURO|nr:uncharacterized protein BGW36DRAFT_360310 [Talaromyces proteolyticus]KAH8696475.1 hypothetical protein BGW36DRAFT_360310 [Talaromyces proteolyticus]